MKRTRSKVTKIKIIGQNNYSILFSKYLLKEQALSVLPEYYSFKLSFSISNSLRSAILTELLHHLLPSFSILSNYYQSLLHIHWTCTHPPSSFIPHYLPTIQVISVCRPMTTPDTMNFHFPFSSIFFFLFLKKLILV